MNVPVEAQSLSTLTTLFANPPQYPRNPTHEVREPLVLYIVRVPGSKDVFLTPLKPPTKSSISLEAIQSSLYYLHVVSEKDEEVKQSLEDERRSEELERPQVPIHRKPLPSVPHANYPASERPAPPPKSYPSYQQGPDTGTNASQVERYQTRGVNLNFGHAQGADRGLHMKSTSPRRFQKQEDELLHHHTASSNISPHIGNENRALYIQPSGFDSGRASPSFQQSPLDEISTNTTSLGAYDTKTKSSSDLGQRIPLENDKSPITVTLIRRDPVSGGQWNVGSILLGQTGVSSGPLDPVSIMLTTPGYSRFSTMHEFQRPGTSFSDADSIKAALAGELLTGGTVPVGSAPRKPFTRIVEYQQQSTGSRSFRIHRRTDSSDSITKPPSPTKSIRQVFSFLSPWQGTCTFSNGIDGRSLRCRHTLGSSNYNEDDTTATIAELRFNLPWSVLSPPNEKVADHGTLPIPKLLGPRSGKESIKRGLQQVKKFGREVSKDVRDRKNYHDDQPSFQETSSQSGLESEIDRLSLKLGRERAGGGFKGTSAKLGKLIIEDEGLKMCDLVVAACMGVWWQHYEGKGD